MRHGYRPRAAAVSSRARAPAAVRAIRTSPFGDMRSRRGSTRRILRPTSFPSTGHIVAWRPGEGEGVRVDCGLESGAEVGPHYDSLLAKVIAFGADREEARRRLVRALRDTFVAGVATNRDFLIDALSRREFVDGEATTAFLAVRASARRAAEPRSDRARRAPVRRARGRARADRQADRRWRASPLRLAVDGVEARASVRQAGRGADRDARRRNAGDAASLPRRRTTSASPAAGSTSAPLQPATATSFGSTSTAPAGASSTGPTPRRGSRTKTPTAPCARRSAASSSASRRKVGDEVRRGQALATVEAMKMQYSILAPIDGVVQTANAAARRPGAGAGDPVRHRAARRPLRWTRPSSPAR